MERHGWLEVVDWSRKAGAGEHLISSQEYNCISSRKYKKCVVHPKLFISNIFVKNINPLLTWGLFFTYC